MLARHATILALLTAVPGLAQTTPPAVTITVMAEAPDAQYARGQTVTFLVSATADGQLVTSGEIVYRLTLDGGKLICSGTGQLGSEPTRVTGKLDEPGVLRCDVTLQQGGQPVHGLGAAAVSPELITPSAPEPADFVAFWEAQKRRLRALPADIQLERDPASNERATYYRVTMANIGGRRVHGYLGVPTAPGKHPAVLQVPAAGVYQPGPWWASLAERGFLTMGITIHDYPLDVSPEQLKEIDAKLLGYQHWGRESRLDYYFRQAFLGCVRAMDLLCARPEWNGRDLMVYGSSQGGGLSLVCAGLDQRVTALAANVPALCDHLGYLVGRSPGWPGLVPDGDPAVARVAPYYDAVNFARHAHCRAMVTVALVDLACAPMGVYAAYNMLPGPKEIVVTPTQGHVLSQEYYAALERVIQRELGEPAAADKQP